MWLVRMSAHALADSGAGETPLIPLALLEEADRAVGGPGAEAIHMLCEALLEVQINWIHDWPGLMLCICLICVLPYRHSDPCPGATTRCPSSPQPSSHGSLDMGLGAVERHVPPTRGTAPWQLAGESSWV